MRRKSAVCASPWHRGDRYIAARLDAFERRIEFRRLTDRGREAVAMDRIVCRTCMRAEVDDRRQTGNVHTAALFPGAPLAKGVLR